MNALIVYESHPAYDFSPLEVLETILSEMLCDTWEKQWNVFPIQEAFSWRCILFPHHINPLQVCWLASTPSWLLPEMLSSFQYGFTYLPLWHSQIWLAESHWCYTMMPKKMETLRDWQKKKILNTEKVQNQIERTGPEIEFRPPLPLYMTLKTLPRPYVLSRDTLSIKTTPCPHPCSTPSLSVFVYLECVLEIWQDLHGG